MTYTTQWKDDSPASDTTYDLRFVTSTAYPSKSSVFLIGKSAAALRTCVLGGTLHGHPDDSQTWQYYHDQMSGACVQIVAREWIEVRDTRCDGAEDGIRPEENAFNANNTSVFVSGTYLTNIRDDCIENDFTLGGVLSDNLWDGCHTGISERPCCGRAWKSPPSETLTLDHMLIGLRKSPNTKPGTVVLGENSLFKWSASANTLVIKCSVFKVDAVSINGTKSMAVPPSTVIDDSACPQNPSTIVWLGGGPYPAPTGGLRVVSDPKVWDDAVSAWKSAHGYPPAN